MVRKVCFSEREKNRSWFDHIHSPARSIADVIGENPDRWVEEFPAVRDKLLLCLRHAQEQIAGRPQTAKQEITEQEILCIVVLLRRLDPIIEAILRFPSGSNSYPSPPRSDQYTIVRKPRTSFYSLYRLREHLATPPPLQHGEFEKSLGLVSTYVVPPLVGGQYFEWTIDRIPEQIETVWRTLAEKEISFILLSFPHGPFDPAVDFDHHGFRVRNLGQTEPQIREQVVEQVYKYIEKGASVLLFPELTASDALNAKVGSLLAHAPNRIGMVVPGSRHLKDSQNVWRNRCTAMDSMGRDSAVVHDKFTRYALPEKEARRLMQVQSSGEVLEGIEVTPRRIRLYDSPTLGRFTILICRDIIEPQTAGFLRLHSLDHIFVISMSPSLDDFKTICSKLGRELDCGVYVVNTAFGEKPEPAFLYRPIRGKDGIESCPREAHGVCVFELCLNLARPRNP